MPKKKVVSPERMEEMTQTLNSCFSSNVLGDVFQILYENSSADEAEFMYRMYVEDAAKKSRGWNEEKEKTLSRITPNHLLDTKRTPQI